MEAGILRLIYDYSVKGKIADLKFVDKIIEIIVTKRSLNDYVQNIMFTNQLDKSDDGVVLATYNYSCRKISVDFESIQFLLEYDAKYDSLFNTLEQVMFRNFKITQVILHELEHAYQYMQVDDNLDNSIETKLIKASLELKLAMNRRILSGEISSSDFATYVLQYKELYRQLYTFNPTERLAQVNSFRAVVSSIGVIKDCVPSLYEFESASLNETMLNGYVEAYEEGCASPTQLYLFASGQSKAWSELDFYDDNTEKLENKLRSKYNLGERFKFGLPVSGDEYQKTYSLLLNSNKYNC